MKIEIIGADAETRAAVTKVITAGPRPLAERITQGPVRLNQNPGFKRIVLNENGIVANFYAEFVTRSEEDANAELFVEAVTVCMETGRTPAQLRDERAELIASLSRITRLHELGLFGPAHEGITFKNSDLPETLSTARELLTRLQS